MDYDDSLLYEVNGRVYRRNPFYKINEKKKNKKIDKTMEDETKYDSSRGCWYMKFSVPAEFQGKLVGVKGINKKTMEKETGCKIFIPNKGDTDTKLEIISKISYENVERCKQYIDDVIFEARSKMPFSHFVSFSFYNNQTLCEKFNLFIKKVKEVSIGLDADYFQLPQKLHITISMLMLVNKDEENIVINKLKTVINDMVRPLLSGKHSFKIKIKDLCVMNEDPKNANVLYGNVSCPVLQNISEEINNVLKETRFCTDTKEDLNLHLTLLNSTFLKKRDGKIRTFDATKIIQQLNDFDFGDIEISKVTLHQRFANNEDGSYNIIHEESFI
uniref:KH domain-containing protein n=1 Tax=Parastrongyloides trichosuri TaxID=131310 RepID=A0A0N5A1W4_PARTI